MIVRILVRSLLVLVPLAAVAMGARWMLRDTAIVTRVETGKAVSAVPGSVTVRAEYQMEIKSDVAGRVAESELDPGREYKKGDFLVQLDTRDLELQIAQIEADYAAAKQKIAVGSATTLELANVKEGVDDAQRRLERGQISQADLERAKRQLQAVELRVALEKVANEQMLATFENTLKAKRNELAKMTIKAPFDGVISEYYARPGSLIGVGSPVGLLISNTRTVEATVSEENFAGLKVGLRGSVRFLSYGGEQFRATVDKVLPTANPQTQRYIVHLKVEIPPQRLVPGLTGEASIIVSERENALIIPRRALVADQVWVVKDGVVEVRRVEKGYESLNDVEILKGLTAGDEVIVEEIDRFRAGDRVSAQVFATR